MGSFVSSVKESTIQQKKFLSFIILVNLRKIWCISELSILRWPFSPAHAMDKRFTESFSKICGTSTYCTCCGSHSSTKREVVSVKHYKSQFFKETFSDPNNIFQLNCFLPTSQNLDF